MLTRHAMLQRLLIGGKKSFVIMALFGKRDLGLALSDKIEDNDLAATHDLTAADVTQAGLKAKIDPTKKIQRLRPGMVLNLYTPDISQILELAHLLHPVLAAALVGP